MKSIAAVVAAGVLTSAIVAVALPSIVRRAMASESAAGSMAKVGVHPGGIGLSPDPVKLTPKAGHELAAFSEGCFWGSENVFRHVKGVTATAVGYTGGNVAHPTYEEVCSHTTGHCETVLVEFDPKVVTYQQLLYAFWNSHDPTQVDGQGPDLGSNYRSAIWTFTPMQMKEALASEAAEQKQVSQPISCQIAQIGTFWMAEEYHQQYDEKTGTESCPVFLRKPIPSKPKG